MNKIDIKSVFLGIALGTVGLGLVTVFAANGIQPIPLNAKITVDGAHVPLENSLVTIMKDGEINGRIYGPMKEIFEYLGYDIIYDGRANTLHLKTPKEVSGIPEPNVALKDADKPATIGIMPQDLIEGGIANTTNALNTYTYEGVLQGKQYHVGDPFTAEKGGQLTFKLNSLQYVSGEPMLAEEEVMGVIYGAGDENHGTLFTFSPSTTGGDVASFPTGESADYHIKILNYSGKEIAYSITLTIE